MRTSREDFLYSFKRSGHGFRNFGNYSLRLILNCGVIWQDHNPTPLAGHSPRSAA